MALEDFTVGSLSGVDSGEYYWYKNASGKMNSSDTSVDFGKGYTNTGKIIEIWNKNGSGEGSYTGATQNEHDIWGYIQNEYAKGWYVPSRGEWAAFADYFTKETDLEPKLTSNYETGTYVEGSGNYNIKYGLSIGYWSSSHNNSDPAWYVNLSDGNIYISEVYGTTHVRLGTTF